ncbi:neuraminidase-like domain-containing protein [Micromonospora sp. C95]|uniref:Tc toxin subunit A-related protein n=1 Tax=Micromonospora sp. C95 TaxID=2824882 RepID=UPI001B36358C|nr:neuraminidase-like domain-containing protein [Micromonospora sp. C95]MBQ1023766.1 peptidoglycan-binding protein [Micromonospora sp. C95]
MPVNDGRDEETVRLAPVVARTQHEFTTASKTRVARIHRLLAQAGQQVDPAEVAARTFGPTTTTALRAVTGGAVVTDEVTARLKARALAAKLSSRTQVAGAHRALRRALEIAKVSAPIDGGELRSREVGPTTRAAISAFQRRYGLPATGEFDPATWERMASVNASRPQPVRALTVKPDVVLAPLHKTLRLNMRGPEVGRAQQALAKLGLTIAVAEHGQQRFGGTTRAAVLEYQHRKHLRATGHLDKPTLRALNQEITGGAVTHPYRLRGTVRDEHWRGLGGVTVQVRERPVRGEGTLVAERRTLANGFFDIPYPAAARPAQLEVTFVRAGQSLGSRVVANPKMISWVNLTLGDQPYRGTSDFETRMRAVAAVLDGIAITDLVETEQDQEVTRVAVAARLTQDEVMRLLLAHRVAAELGAPLTPATCYGFLAQNLPPTLPDDLLAATDEWNAVDRLVDDTATGLGFLDPETATAAFDAATAANLFPIGVTRQRDTILAALAARRTAFTLDKPILTGSGTLRGLLAVSAVDESAFGTVADAFVRHQGPGPEFWAELTERAAQVGGEAAVADLRTTVEVAQVAANDTALVQHLKQVIADPDDPTLTSARGLARLTVTQWRSAVEAAGGGVATELAERAEQLFPDVALVAHVGRATGHGLTHVPQVAEFLDERPDFVLREANVDSYVARNAPGTDPAVVAELRVVQRVHRLAPDADTGSRLLGAGIHSSAQLLALGADGLARTLPEVGAPVLSHLLATAQLQYAQVLDRIAEFRRDLHPGDPYVLGEQNLTAEQVQEVLGEIPNLELLFGPLDYCDCPGCLSVYSPAAYLADLLRFLGNRPAVAPDTTVLDVLLDRRPDLADVKLNCANTETPMPYVDLVCEVLESRIPGAPPAPQTWQTTRVAAEVRAFPEHQRAAAYDTLRQADHLTGDFDLWQEEARLLLEHLGVPRPELMAAFAGTNPTEVSVAGEYFGLSSHATTLVTTVAADAATQTDVWGLDATRTQLTVAEFLQHSRLSYDELLELLRVPWSGPVTLDRPDGTCDLDRQRLTGLTPAVFDRLHRFLRLWRHTPWRLHELGQLLAAPGVCDGELDGEALVALHRFAQVCRRLALPVSSALSLYDTIGTTAEPGQVSPYDALFQNKLLTNPVDPAFTRPLPGTEPLAAHRATLAAAYQVTEAELVLLLARTGPLLTLDTLTVALRHVTLARGLRIPIADLLLLVDLCHGTLPDPFAHPQATLDLIGRYEEIARSGFAVSELDHLLHHRPDSPFEPREDTVTQQVEALRESLRSTPAADLHGQTVAHVAVTFGLADQQSAVLLDALGLLTDLSDPELTEQDSDGVFVNPVTPVAFPAIYRAWRLLHKTAILVRRLRVEPAVLGWLLDRAGTAGWLHPGDLPVTAPPAGPLFDRWRQLVRWLHLRARYPEPEEVTLAGIFDAALAAAPIGELRTALGTLAHADPGDLSALDGGDPAAYADVVRLERILHVLGLARRLGVDVVTARSWARRDGSATAQRAVTREIGQIVKAKYDHDVWLARITPIQDALRERKRAALVAYLLEESARDTPPTITVDGREYANPGYWRDTNDMLRWFLLDVEMSACQLTSRIKQAIGSVQMFVQRCQLNLERPLVVISADEAADTTSLDSWRQWTWMKNYRVWEANRKVFLYPENWIEPELRDDKTPFFTDLEDDILQGEITDASCETAFHRYLRKVHEVSRLTVVGTYHEIDAGTNVLHVVARTPADPARYFYRTFDLSYGRWTAWEKIELDIVGDHVVPVVYNRRLHLFWLVFAEKTQQVRKQPPARATETPTDTPEPPKLLEIQLAWSVRTPDGFAARRTSPFLLVHPWQRPTSAYHLKPRYKSRENHLWLDVYLSTTQEFNNTRFYDPYADQYAYVTKNRFDERLRPWHSSSFVFDGEVVALKLKPLRGQYRVLLPGGTMSSNPVTTNSYVYVHDSLDSRALAPLSGPYEIAPRLVLPEGMHFEFTRLTNNRRHAANGSAVRVISGGTSVTLARGGKAPFEVAQSPHQIQYDVQASLSPLLYQDRSRSFFILPRWRPMLISWWGANAGIQWFTVLGFTWYPFHHPYTALFLRELGRSGLDGLLNRRIQRFPQHYPPGNAFTFAGYQPAAWNAADSTAATDVVDFTAYGAYAQYNWEIFCHAPLLIAGKLVANQRFEEAMRWYHRIFDPTNTEALSAPQRYWITKPFFDQNSEDYRRQRIETLLNNLAGNLDQVREWKNNPFNPHLIARRRPVAFQRAVVMKYLDLLIAWGDQLFRRDTLESINEATLLYVLAAELLGPRPVKVPPVEHAELSYRELVGEGPLDPLGNTTVDVVVENFVPAPGPGPVDDLAAPGVPAAPLPHLEVRYFGIPANTRLLSYWDTVADRLYKVRNCMNIEGVVRQLPLFEPPIDPALLVKAAAAGIDLSSVLGVGALPAGQYRFRTLAERAATLCAEVRALGERLLSALERRDAEGLALLHAGNEVSLRQAVRAVREEQVDEALKTQAALEKGLPVLDKRIQYHGDIPRMNAWEIAGTVSHGLGIVSEIVATVLNAVAGGTAFIPYITAGAAGFGGSPLFTVSYGEQPSKSSFNFAAMFAGLSGILHHAGEMMTTQGGYTRQDEANQFNKRLAELERQQLEVQIEVAGIRHGIAELELANHELSIAHADAAHAYLTEKYTSAQLYDWLVGRLSTTYFQAYQLAFDLARRAEQAFRLELAEPGASFVQFGYWDSLKKGLLAADRLGNDLRRMEVAYLDRHAREFEITKHVSLAEVAPLSLLALKLTGSATVALPEWLFDLDYPGHYRRRIRSVALSVPCVVGPYTSVNCTLSLTNNGIRLTDSVAGGYGDPLAGPDERFVRNPVPVAAIATSHGANDRGMFELGFADERYLPFELAGAVSEWRIDLPRQNNRFDFDTIGDVVLHLDYTAVAGSTALADAARANVDATLPTAGTQMFVLDEQFATAWHRMLHPEEDGEQTLTVTLTPDHLPFWAKARIADGGTATVTAVDVILDAAEAFDGQVAVPGGSFSDVPGPLDGAFGGVPHLALVPAPGTAALGEWRLRLRRAGSTGWTELVVTDVHRAYLVLRFTVS